MASDVGHGAAIGLRVPGALVYRHLAIRLVSTACKMALDADTAGEEFEAELVSAFGEAFNNIAVHAYGDGASGDVQIEVGWSDGEVEVTLMDSGRTFDPETVATPNLDDLPEGGLGIFIIRRCVDHMDYHPGPPNVMRLVKRRDRGICPGGTMEDAGEATATGVDTTSGLGQKEAAGET